jgi:hypothetical protein
MYDGRAVRHTWLLVFSPIGERLGAAVAEIEAVTPKAIEEATSKAGHIERDSRDASHDFLCAAPNLQPVFERRAIERRASFRTRKGRSNSFNPRIVLSDNRFRFSGRCASSRHPSIPDGVAPAP